MERTLNLDEDVAERLEAEAARTHKTVDEVVNEVVRENIGDTPEVPRKPFRVRAVDMGSLLIDISCTSRALAMLDEMQKPFRIEGPFVRSAIEITNVEQVLDNTEGPLRK